MHKKKNEANVKRTAAKKMLLWTKLYIFEMKKKHFLLHEISTHIHMIGQSFVHRFLK